ncbi:50S ribosomal protein L9 [Candidatus Nomurabacteria bacterium RIFCSPLOWO2_01_FULL_41_21]|uniref:Large ribosomal subunit protein bL9 n=1 Tax=Candidatus Nomurabacteria bacterium RIFCSPLOWO2_01_FULL_41_21 TaxID=1801776 RepID=A0A1F6X2T4_9BACT|nr:MAG: 50S ribosomal protein L9 [Candidatus Nomurabacteria bacterium RIFCSPLOWO2_01_FULL_41_21]
MRVIFLHDVPRVGKKNDVKEIHDGYAMNYLFPKKLAVQATARAIADLEKRKQEIVIEREVQESLLLKNLEEIKQKVVSIEVKADEKGHLFSGIHKKEIIEAMRKEHHAEISEESIVLEKPIKEVGEYEIELKVGTKKSSFKLIVRTE